MEEDLKKIADFWKETYSSQIKESRSFDISADFKKYASVFSLGQSYFYIVNLHDFHLEYISESVKIFLKKKANDVVLKDLMKLILPEEIENINLKSKVISDFYTSFLDKDLVLDYKNMFTYRIRDEFGKLRRMLYQAIPLSILETGMPEHVMCIQTDVTHLKVSSNSAVSFINMYDGKGYFNIDISKGKFDPDSYDNQKNDLLALLTDREMQIVIRLSRGSNAEQIAKELNLSPHTIKTHRRNILNKSGCANTTELVAKCLTGGIISPI